MPNWCSNRVEVNGDDKEIKAWKDLVESKESKFDFNKILPMPKNIYRGNLGEEEEEKYGKKNWYHWSLENWGCKWNTNPDGIEVIDDGDQIVYHFSTPWSPPVGIYEKLRDKFPDLGISWFYDEPNMHYAGYLE